MDAKFSNSIGTFSADTTTYSTTTTTTKLFGSQKLSRHLSLHQAQQKAQQKAQEELYGSVSVSGPISKMCSGGQSVSDGNMLQPISKGFPSLSSVSSGSSLPMDKNYGGSGGSTSVLDSGGGLLISKGFRDECMGAGHTGLAGTKGFSRSVTASGIAPPVRSQSISCVGNTLEWNSGSWGTTPSASEHERSVNVRLEAFTSQAGLQRPAFEM